MADLMLRPLVNLQASVRQPLSPGSFIPVVVFVVVVVVVVLFHLYFPPDRSFAVSRGAFRPQNLPRLSKSFVVKTFGKSPKSASVKLEEAECLSKTPSPSCCLGIAAHF